MPVKEFPCPQCGAEVAIGLPKGGTVKSITTSERPETTGSKPKARQVRCRNDHEFFVLFEW
ncbi:transcriptional regulator Brz [Halobaculum rubrum]|uniref:transcriptional regulator Brz n=1 Tax=Halobaculum rubrum TaxID=2872158 RepID=UPI001CA40156|nr:transcriptional regulator Brz [Halobaculum rubrum]QZX99106.1 transcriptional regulator [Halobaculum rubrum]